MFRLQILKDDEVGFLGKDRFDRVSAIRGSHVNHGFRKIQLHRDLLDDPVRIQRRGRVGRLPQVKGAVDGGYPCQIRPGSRSQSLPYGGVGQGGFPQAAQTFNADDLRALRI